MHEPETLLGFDELSPPDKRTVYWGCLWRTCVTSLCGWIGGAIAGGIAGLLAALVGGLFGVNVNAHPGALQIAGGIAGFAVGCVMFWYYLAWLFSVKLGRYRLRLVAADMASSKPATEQQLNQV